MKNTSHKHIKNKIVEAILSFQKLTDISKEISKSAQICLDSIKKKKKNNFLWKWRICC